jgi:hypothetical protein
MKLYTLANVLFPLVAVAANVNIYPNHYTYGFVEPEAPLIRTDYTANFMQVSHEQSTGTMNQLPN